MSRVEFTILDKDAHCRNVIARAPCLRFVELLDGPHGFSSSSSSIGGSSTVMALVRIWGSLPSVSAVTLTEQLMVTSFTFNILDLLI
jgi:hypothetical protein